MTTPTPSPAPVTLALLALSTIALTACELRQEGADQAAPPDPAESATLTPSPSESATPANSILRDDIAPETIVELPPEPVALTIPFPDGTEITPRARQMLAGILRSDAVQQDWPVVIGGHTDSSGNDQANLRTSRARAEAVAAWLVERGVDDARIVVIAFGEQNPVAPNALPDGSANEAGRSANRRVELRIAPPVAGPASAADAGETAATR